MYILHCTCIFISFASVHCSDLTEQLGWNIFGLNFYGSPLEGLTVSKLGCHVLNLLGKMWICEEVV